MRTSSCASSSPTSRSTGSHRPAKLDASGHRAAKNLRPVRKRVLVDEVRREWGTSIRRTCRLVEMDTSTHHYRSRRPDQAPLRARIQEICAVRVRYGYRRVHVPRRREGWPVNHKRSYRLYEELGLQLRNETPKRRVTAKLREDRSPAAKPNDVWAMELASPAFGSSTISWRPARRSGCCRWSTRSRGSHRLSTRAFRIAARTSFEPSKRSVPRSAIRRRSGSTEGRSSSPATSTCGPTHEV